MVVALGVVVEMENDAYDVHAASHDIQLSDVANQDIDQLEQEDGSKIYI